MVRLMFTLTPTVEYEIKLKDYNCNGDIKHSIKTISLIQENAEL